MHVALSFHGCLKSCLIDRQFALTGDVRREIHREPVGVVELEHDIAGQLLAIKIRDRRLENLHALVERLGKPCLFFRQHFLDVRLRLGELGISVAHFLDERRNELVEEQSSVPSFLPWRIARRMMRRSTYPLPSLPGNTPSTIRKEQARM